jgi:ribose/xylose/arabinose/galactoside ABC-type transport system permease subunit
LTALAITMRHSIRSRFNPPASVWLTLVVFALFALVVPRFATVGNMENLLRVASILCIVACGQAIVLIIGGIEFSFGSSVALASIMTVLTLPELGVAGGFATGGAVILLIGALNGALIGRFDLPPFLVTLGMLMAVAGLAATLAGGLPIDAPLTDAFTWPARGRVAGVPVPIIAAALSIIALYGLLTHTHIGRLWYLVGANPEAARLSGIKVRITVFAGYLVASGFCALASVILTSRVGSGQPSLAPNLPFETIAACAIGGIPLSGGQGRASQVVCGVLIIAMMNNAVVLLNLPVAYQQLMMAGVILGAVVLQKMSGPILMTWQLLARRRAAR